MLDVILNWEEWLEDATPPFKGMAHQFSFLDATLTPDSHVAITGDNASSYRMYSRDSKQ